MLVPRTFRFDKYQFHTDKKLETVPRPDAVRPVGKSPAVPQKQGRPGGMPAQPLREDSFGGTEDIPPEWTQQYFRRRVLWSPRDQRELSHGPAKILLFWEGEAFSRSHLAPCKEWTNRYHSHLTLLQILPESSSIAPKVRQEELQQQTRDYPVSEIKVQNWRDSLEGLLETVAQGSYAMVVMGRENGEFAAKVLKESSVPVLILPKEPQASWSIRKVLVPVEGTAFSYPAISEAMILAQDFGAELLLFQVGREKTEKFSGIMERMAWKNIKHDFFQGTGDISRAVSDFAKAQAVDLIVMATHGILPHSVSLPSSVTLEVLEKNDIPLYGVRA